jgi:hypothetical protein
MLSSFGISALSAGAMVALQRKILSLLSVSSSFFCIDVRAARSPFHVRYR